MTRRGSVIVAVLFLLVIGIVVASSVLVAADGSAMVSRSGRERVQSRALAWSGVQAVMAQLTEQRDQLLDGEDPELIEEWELFTLDNGTRGVVRLVDLDPAGVLRVVPESGKLDVNSATQEMLANVPGLNLTLAERIVTLRDEKPLMGLGRLLDVEGITPELLYGDPVSTGDEWEMPVESTSPPSLESGSFGSGEPGGLGRYLTVYAFDPNVQVAIDGAEEFRGNLRVNLDQEWSDALGEAIEERFDADVATIVENLLASGVTFADDAEFCTRLQILQVPPEEWGMPFDVFTTTDDEFLLGRVDVNRASVEVLSCLPEITPEIAQAIVDRRESMDASMKRSPVWLVTEGVLNADQYSAIANWVTARSMQWRVRIEVGLERGDPAMGQAPVRPMSMDDLAASFEEPLDEPSLEHRMVVEAVIDVGSTRGRVAYMRDVTMLDPMVAMMRAESEARETGFVSAAVERQSEREFLESMGFGTPDGDSEQGLDEGSDSDLDEGSGRARESARSDGGLEFGGDMEFGESEPSRGSSGSDPDSEVDRVSTSGEGEGDGGGAVDRRIGRWTTRRAGQS